MKNYLISQKGLLWVLVVSYFAEWLSFWLWHLPMTAVINIQALKLVMLSLYFVYDYHVYQEKQDKLAQAKQNFDRLEAMLNQQIIQEKDQVQVIQAWSHQMKVPLAAMDMMVQADKLDKTQLKSQLFALNNYLDSFLNYQRLSLSTTDFRLSIVNVRQVVADLAKKYAMHFIHKELSLTIQGEWSVKTDEKWLSFALSQLLDNAVKYTPRGGKITIVLKDGVAIQDTGIGILPEDLPRLFEQGFTGYNGRRYKKATGLGLYLSKQILDKLGLDLVISSQIDQGTCAKVLKKA